MPSTSLRKDRHVYFIFALFLFYLFWWIYLNLYTEPFSDPRGWFVDSYGILAGLSGIFGLNTAKKWGGFKSYVGKSIGFFSLGLLGQFLGQVSYSILFYVYHIENAYPSFGEIFFLSTIPFYTLGSFYIGKAAGSSINLKNIKYKIGALVFPVIMIGISYFLFLKGYATPEGESSISIISILDFTYPIGQAIFVSAAILAYYLSGNVLGGVMKGKVAFILLAVIAQYFADSVFLYQTISDTWVTAGFSDILFVSSYFFMGIGIADFDSVFTKLKDGQGDR